MGPRRRGDRRAAGGRPPVTIWLDHVLLVLLAALFPLWAVTFGFRRLKLASREELPRVRLLVYRRAMTIQWSLALIVIGLWVARGRGWTDLGLVPRMTGGLIGVAAGLAVAAFLVLRQRAGVLRDDEALARVRAQLGPLELMLPHSAHELGWFFRLSVTAGVCEELLYRGFLFWYLGHWLGPLPAAGVSALLFGIGHSYQGPRGILLTTAVGAFLSAIYAVTGSLIAPMVAHALMDIHSGDLGYAAFRRARELEEKAPQEPPAAESAHAPVV